MNETEATQGKTLRSRFEEFQKEHPLIAYELIKLNFFKSGKRKFRDLEQLTNQMIIDINALEIISEEQARQILEFLELILEEPTPESPSFEELLTQRGYEETIEQLQKKYKAWVRETYLEQPDSEAAIALKEEMRLEGHWLLTEDQRKKLALSMEVGFVNNPPKASESELASE